jgi:PPOX class probable F420-dependent enzyme
VDVLSAVQERFVLGCRVARLATADASGVPHAAPVVFVYAGGRFYTAVDEKPKTATRLKRIRNIEENPRVVLLFDRYDEDWSKLAWVMVRGRADVIAAGREREEAIAALRGRYAQYRQMRLQGPVIRVTPERVLSWGAIE